MLQKLTAEVASQPGELRDPQLKPAQFHGRSFLRVLEEPEAAEWNEVYGSHTFHEITMYYPMRVVRETRYKLIWNLASPLPFPFASDLWIASTWQAQHRQGLTARYGQRSVGSYLQRPAFELYDLQSDPDEAHNLANDPAQAENLTRLKQKLRLPSSNSGPVGAEVGLRIACPGSDYGFKNSNASAGTKFCV